MKDVIMRVYDVAIDVVVIGLVLVMLVTLGFAFFDVMAGLFRLLPTMKSAELDAADFRDLVSSVLDVFVIIELFSTFVQYVKVRRIRLSMLIDVTAVFVLRDMLVTLYGKTFDTSHLLVLALLLIVLVIARSITGFFPPRPRDQS
ncbi:phosphate-starvation-inducible PsiE family protein [Salinisphaera sp. LB1]|uniref:phosphate-starvation-inducible PsiE family protein n=1 Tax=Salinisphaera sp. LB1 TaxID=2183911 RepID=UPI000D7EA37A|nr:phosphate-starvation-inducible PsiE family protein [Salinisphaera sp. LB1]AWN14992.1 hypothetical protein SALB1_0785 [Salinisphaera sp. LB1]